MNIYLLERTDDVRYDETAGVVVAAKSPQKARSLAYFEAGGDNTSPFMNPRLSTCRLIGTAKPNITEGLLLRDFNAG